MSKTYSEWVDIVNNLAYDEVLVDMLSDWRADGSRLTARIAELEGKIDQLIEAGELLAEYCDYETGKIAWDALVKDWKERDE